MGFRRESAARYVALLWAVWMALEFLWRIPGKVSYLDALTTGRVVDPGALELPVFLLFQALAIALILLSWEVFRGRAPARIRLVILLPLVWLPSLVTAVVGAGPEGQRGIGALASSPWLWRDALLLVVLLSPLGGKAVSSQPRMEWLEHERRVETAKRIGESWQRLGRWDNVILIPVALGSFLVAPITFLAAGLYYLIAVLPLRPGWRRP